MDILVRVLPSHGCSTRFPCLTQTRHDSCMALVVTVMHFFNNIFPSPVNQKEFTAITIHQLIVLVDCFSFLVHSGGHILGFTGDHRSMTKLENLYAKGRTKNLLCNFAPVVSISSISSGVSSGTSSVSRYSLIRSALDDVLPKDHSARITGED